MRQRRLWRAVAVVAAVLVAVTTASFQPAWAATRLGSGPTPVARLWHRASPQRHRSHPAPGPTTTTTAEPGPGTDPGPGSATTAPATTNPTTTGDPTTTGPGGDTTAPPPTTGGPATTSPAITTGPTPTVSGAPGASRSRSMPDTMPAAATSGTPLVKQLRNGQVIATWSSIGAGPSGDGPFTRSHAWNHIQPGDVFEVYPAVYQGPGQLPWIGPLPNNAADYDAGIAQVPTNITIRGVTVNGQRPVLRMGTTGDYNILGHGLVEIDHVDGLTWDNIDIDGTGGQWVDRAGIYVTGSRNVTIRNSRIHGFQTSQHNGVFGAGGNTGTLWLDGLRLFDNGGWDGPSHNVYVNASDTDPNFTLKVTGTWSSAVNVGHLLKSRAQVTIVEHSVLEGTNNPAGWDCAESFGLDVPNGGRVTVHDTVFVKARPGPCANGIAFRYGAEGMDPGRPHSVELTHNTFVATSPVWDDAGHRNLPMAFWYPMLVPGAAGAPAVPVTVSGNRFEGFVTADLDAAARYRGADFVDVPG